MHCPRVSATHLGPDSVLAVPLAGRNWMTKTKLMAMTAATPRIELILFTVAPTIAGLGSESGRKCWFRPAFGSGPHRPARGIARDRPRTHRPSRLDGGVGRGRPGDRPGAP